MTDLSDYGAADLLLSSGSYSSGGLTKTWATFADGSSAEWGVNDQPGPFGGTFRTRPEDVAGTIAEAFLRGRCPSATEITLRDASPIWADELLRRDEYAAFCRDAVVERSTTQYLIGSHVMSPYDHLYRLTWDGREIVVAPHNPGGYGVCTPCAGVQWERSDIAPVVLLPRPQWDQWMGYSPR